MVSLSVLAETMRRADIKPRNMESASKTVTATSVLTAEYVTKSRLRIGSAICMCVMVVVLVSTSAEHLKGGKEALGKGEQEGRK